MKTVTVDEARANLPALLRLVARGKRVLITDGGKRVGVLAPPPPPPPTPEEIAEQQAKAEQAIREWIRMGIEQGNPPPPGDPLWDLLKEGT